MLETKTRQPYCMRLGERERRIISVAAEHRGEPVSTYIRERALEAARDDVVKAVTDEHSDQ